MINKIRKYLPYYLRKKTEKKIVVIESDDWGMERAINEEALIWVEKKYGRKSFTRWTTDALETVEDLNVLFEVLDNYKNAFQAKPIVTANFITHNINYLSGVSPEFISIDNSIKRDNPDLFSMYEFGIKNKLLKPQLHGYSHYNLMKSDFFYKSEEGKEAFLNKFFFAKTTLKGYTSLLEGECTTNNHNYDHQLQEAQQAFLNMFGYYSTSFIPPRFIIDKEIIDVLSTNHIQMLQAGNRLITSNQERYYVPYYRSFKKQIWFSRNCRLDPHQDYNFDGEYCIQNIKDAFKSKQPAVIDMHRVNFSGKYTPGYRDRTLTELNKVLLFLKSNYPDTLFTSTDKLIDIF